MPSVDLWASMCVQRRTTCVVVQNTYLKLLRWTIPLKNRRRRRWHPHPPFPLLPFLLHRHRLAARRGTLRTSGRSVRRIRYRRSLHFLFRFTLNPPQRPFFFGWTRWIVCIARRAKPWARRIDLRSARGLHAFIRLFRTQAPACLPFLLIW